MYHWLLLLSGNRLILKILLSSHHFYWKGRNSWISKTNLNVKMFGWGNLIFVDLKWNKYISLRNFQQNFKFVITCIECEWEIMNSEKRFGVLQIYLALFFTSLSRKSPEEIGRMHRYHALGSRKRSAKLFWTFELVLVLYSERYLILPILCSVRVRPNHCGLHVLPTPSSI